MSSRDRQERSPGGLIGQETPEDLIANPAAEGTNRFGLGIAGLASMLEVRPTAFIDPHLGDGDPVEGRVELTVAATAQAMAGPVARPDGDGCRPVVTGERLLGSEAGHAGGLADDLGGGQRPTPREGEEARRQATNQRLDLALEGPNGETQLADPGQQVAGEPGDGLGRSPGSRI